MNLIDEQKTSALAEGTMSGAMPTILDERWVELVRQVQTSSPIDPGELGWEPETIVLTRDCDRRPHEAVYCERLIAAFPDAKVVDRRDIAHNRVPVPGETASERIARGKTMLVLGAIRKPVSINRDPEARDGTLCAPYYAVHPTWFCFYDCEYCYLGGSPGVRFSPTVRIFTNQQDILEAMARVLKSAQETVSFYVGKVQDGMQLDPVANHSQVLAPFALYNGLAHIVFLTKSRSIGRLTTVYAERRGQGSGDARGHVAVAWSINADEITALLEHVCPPLDDRLWAAREWARAGGEVRYNIMPLIPFEGWQAGYADLISRAFGAATPSRVTVGGICSYPGALGELRKRSRAGGQFGASAASGHGRRQRWPLETREEMYGLITRVVSSVGPHIPVSLCLESREAWLSVGLDPRQSSCTCVAGCCDLQGVSQGDW